MITDVAEVKPTVTGMDMKSISTPTKNINTMVHIVAFYLRQPPQLFCSETVSIEHKYVRLQTEDLIEKPDSWSSQICVWKIYLPKLKAAIKN